MKENSVCEREGARERGGVREGRGGGEREGV